MNWQTGTPPAGLVLAIRGTDCLQGGHFRVKPWWKFWGETITVIYGEPI